MFGGLNDNLVKLASVIFAKTFHGPNDVPISNYLLPKRGKGLLKKNVISGTVPVVAGGLKPAAFHNASNTKAPVITISASGANAGYVHIWGEKVWSSDSSYIDVSNTDYIFFWYLLLKSRQKQIFDSQSGSAQPHIYPKHIGNILIPKLEMNKVQQFNEIITPVFNKIFQNNLENKILYRIKDSLLSKYFN